MAFGMGGIKQLNVGMGIDPSPMTQGLNQASRMLSTWSSSQASTMRKLGTSIQALGVAASGAAVAIAGGFGVAINEAIKLEEKFGQIQALTEANAKTIEDWKEGMKDVARQTGAGPKEIAEGLYFVASAGMEGAEALDAVKQASMGARMGMGEVGDISRALVAITATYAGEEMNAAKAMDLLTQSVKVGAAEANEYAASIGRILPVAKLAKQDIEQVFAAVSTFTVTGASGSEAITAISGLMRDLAAPSRTAIKAFEMLKAKGYDVQAALAGPGGLHAALQMIKEAVGDDAQALRILLPNIEGMTAAVALMGGLSDAYAANLKRMYDANGVTAESFAKMKETVSFQMSQMKAEIQLALVELGQAALPEFRQFIPDLEDMARELVKLLGHFNELGPATKKWTLILLATAGPAMMMWRQFAPIVLGIGAAFVTAGKMIVGAMVTGEASVKGFKLATESLTRAELFTAMGSKIASFLKYGGTGLGGLSFGGMAASVKGLSISFAGLKTAAVTSLTAVKAGIVGVAGVLGPLTIAITAMYAAWWAGGELGKWLGETFEPIRLAQEWLGGLINKLKGFNLKELEQGTIIDGMKVGLKPGSPEWEAKFGAAQAGGAAPSPGQKYAQMLGIGSLSPEQEKLADASIKAGNSIAMTRDLVQSFGREQKAAAKEVDNYRQELEELSGVAADKELAKMAQQLRDIGGAEKVADLEGLGKKIADLAKQANTVPPELAEIARKIKIDELLKENTEKVKEAAAEQREAIEKEYERIAGLIGPTTKELAKQMQDVMNSLTSQTHGGAALGIFTGLTDKALQQAASMMEELGQEIGYTAAQSDVLQGIYEEMMRRKILPDTTDAGKKTINWKVALQGVALLAQTMGGKFGDMLQVVQNIGDAFKDWKSLETWQDKLGAIAGAVGQIGGMVGGKAGGFLQGAAGGAMAGSAFGVPGAIVGGAIGGIMGLFGKKKKEQEEQRRLEEENRLAIENMTKSIEDQYGSLGQARTYARNYGIDLQKALDSNKAEELEAALADLEKRQAGMKEAMEGAAGLASYKTKSPEAAKAQGALFGTVFWAAVKTEGLMAASEALGGPFKTMWENASEEMQTLLAPIKQQMDLAANSAFASAAQGASDLQKVVAGLADASMISTQDLANASTLAWDQYKQALGAAKKEGLEGSAAQEAAIRAVGPAVGELIAQYERLGIPLDDNLLKLKGIAEEQGMIFPEDAMTKAADAMERVAIALEKAFGFSTGVANNMDRMSNVSLPDGRPGGRDQYSAARGFGPRVLRRDTTIHAHAGEGALIIPRDRMGRAHVSAARGLYTRDSMIDEGIYERPERTYPSPIEESQTEATIRTVVEETFKKVTPVLIEAMKKQKPVTVENKPVINVQENPMEAKESREALRKFTLNEVEQAIRLGQGRLLQTIKDAVGQ